MTSKFKSLNDSDLDLACGGGSGAVDQNHEPRLDPDNVDGDATSGDQVGGSAIYDGIAQVVEYPNTAL